MQRARNHPRSLALRVAWSLTSLLAGSDCTPIEAPHVAPGAGGRTQTTSNAESQACAAGMCWWSSMQAGCATAGLPMPEQRPSADASASDLPDLYFGWTDIYMQQSGADDPSSGPSLGFDLDGTCSNATSCPGQRDVVSCRSNTSAPADGPNCRDNGLANLLEIFARVPDLGARFGLNEASINCGLARGSYNTVVRVSGYNGLADDDQVRVDWYTSPGIDPQPDWQCPSRDVPSIVPTWRSTSLWKVDAETFVAPAREPATLPASRVSDASAYVRGNYLISRLPEGAPLWLSGNAAPYRGLALPVRAALWTGRLSRPSAEGWRIDDGLVAGRVSSQDLLQSLNQTGFCNGMGIDALYASVSAYILDNSDLLASGASDPNMPCDAVSFGIGFHAASLTPEPITTTHETLIACCAPGMSAADCQPSCGDGQVSGGEQCDTAIAQGHAGACPAACSDADPCMPETLVGQACDAHCSAQPITNAQSGDGCCPAGANSTEDSDCKPVCGNGILEHGESCERAHGGCPPCVSDDPCLIAQGTGSADDCTAECTYTSINTCRAGDRCCPKGCSPTTDGDCSSACGDGDVNPVLGETCEAKSALPCDAPCDDGDPCTIDISTGSALNCNAICTHALIVKPDDGDGCCPVGANTHVDADCASTCGNGSIEGDEECDDGARVNGDGCSDHCKRETALQTCLSWVGPQQPGSGQMRGDACSQCVCGHCMAEASTCFTDPDADKVRRCSGIVECVRATWCNGAACFCGEDLLACVLGNPTGPCKQEVQSAAGSAVPATILAAGSDSSSPVGRANALASCAYKQCADACDFH